MFELVDYASRFDSLEQQLSIVISEEQRLALLKHLFLVMEKNKEMNLTAIKDFDQAFEIHLADSLLPLPLFKSLDAKCFCDLGTGAGFPGIPLTIMTGSSSLLVDSVKKKTVAVQSFINELGLNDRCNVSSLRAEDLALKQPACFDVITARALSSLPSLLELSSPLLKKGGFLLALKASPSEDEISQGNVAAGICGMKLLSVTETKLLPSESERRFFLYQKTSKPSIKLPRRIGLAQKQPLGL